MEFEVGEGKDSIEREKKRTGLGPFIKRVNIKRPLRVRLDLPII